MQSFSYVAPPRRSPHLRLKGLAPLCPPIDTLFTKQYPLGCRNSLVAPPWPTPLSSLSLQHLNDAIGSEVSGSLPAHRQMYHGCPARCPILTYCWRRCAGRPGRGRMAGGAGWIDRCRHAGRVIALIIYRRGPRFIGTNSRTHGTVHGGAKHDVTRHKHDASTIMNMSSRSRPPPLRLVVSISGRSLLPPGTRLVPW